MQRAWQTRDWARFLGTMIAALVVWQAMRLAFSPAHGAVLELAVAVLSWPVADMLLGYLRLRRVRRAMRTQRAHVAPIHWGLAYTAHLSRCGRCTTAEPRCRTGHMLRAGLDPVTVERWYTWQAEQLAAYTARMREDAAIAKQARKGRTG